MNYYLDSFSLSMSHFKTWAELNKYITRAGRKFRILNIRLIHQAAIQFNLRREPEEKMVCYEDSTTWVRKDYAKL